jgi:hypothetical protein
MAAIITDDFRKQNAGRLYTDILDSTNNNSPKLQYYVGIGKSEPWDNDVNNRDENNGLFVPPVPANSILERQDAKNNLISLAQVNQTTGAYRLIPKVTWSAGQKYQVYDKSNPECFNTVGEFNPCYALNEADNIVYICLGNNNGGFTSTTITNSNASVAPYEYLAQNTSGDNYIWAACFKVDTTSNNKYANARGFISIQTTKATGNPSSASTNAGKLRARTGGLLYGFRIKNGGTGYTVASGTIVGSTRGSVHQSPSEITERQLPITKDSTGKIIGYTWNLTDATSGTNPFQGDTGILEASVGFDDAAGSGADIIPLIAPSNGFGFDPLDDLPSYYVGVYAEFSQEMDSDGVNDSTFGDSNTDDAIINIDYRQISLIKGPERIGNIGGDSSATAMNTLKTIKLGASHGLTESTLNAGLNLQDGVYMEQDDNGGDSQIKPRAWVDYIHENSTDRVLFYHQNSHPKINLKPIIPNANSDIKFYSSSGTLIDTLTATNYEANTVFPEYKIDTGNVLFVENRQPITRSSSQTEEVRLIIQL